MSKSLYENTIKVDTQYDYELHDISSEPDVKLLKLSCRRIHKKSKI